MEILGQFSAEIDTRSSSARRGVVPGDKRDMVWVCPDETISEPVHKGHLTIQTELINENYPN